MSKKKMRTAVVIILSLIAAALVGTKYEWAAPTVQEASKAVKELKLDTGKKDEEAVQ